MSDFAFKTPPYAHQRRFFEASRDREFCALFLEMGLGKTKIVIDTAAWLLQENRIDGLLVLAPNGVHRVWTDDELPRHLPDDAPRLAVAWRSGGMSTVAARRGLEELIAFRGLAVMAMNVEAAITRAGRVFAGRFLARRRCLMVVDESILIKSPAAQRTKAICALGRRAPYRRILSGVPISQGPLDLYAQMNFLRRGLLGYTTFHAFKHAFAEWEPARDRRTGRAYEVLKGYRNQALLLERCAPHALRATKEECLDLPPKLYVRRPFALAPPARALYNRLRAEYVADLDAGECITVAHALTRVLRLQQVASGYWPPRPEAAPCAACGGAGCDACEGVGFAVIEEAPRAIGPNARLRALTEVIGELPEGRQLIVWCRFRWDVDRVCEALGGAAVRYDGATPPAARAAAVGRFQAGAARFFVGTSAGGRGLTLTAASAVVFYSHGWSYEGRAQMEDRAHRIGQVRSVTYVDLVAEETVDDRIMEAIAIKRDLAALFDRDPRTWLR